MAGSNPCGIGNSPMPASPGMPNLGSSFFSRGGCLASLLRVVLLTRMLAKAFSLKRAWMGGQVR
jgi:hypothetical protein